MKTKQHQQPLRAVAQIRKIFGVRGEMKIESFSRTIDEFERLENVLLGTNESDVVPCEIESVKMRGDDIYLKLRGVDDKTAADQIRGKYLFVEESFRKELPKEKFFIDELIGCAVLSEGGKKFGTVTSVDAYPAQMVYTVKTRQGYVMLPAVREFIVNVDVEKKEIVVRPPDGLFTGEML
ncbi:MAG: ribosome maturation factor RimM [Bacteroidota bacterium]